MTASFLSYGSLMTPRQCVRGLSLIVLSALLTSALHALEQAEAAVGWVWDARYLNHQTGAGHPERPARLTWIKEAVTGSRAAEPLMPITPRPIADKWLLTCHRQAYLDAVAKAIPARGLARLPTGDTVLSPDSL